VARRLLARLGRQPGDAPRLVELHDVVLPDAALSDRHREHIADPSDALRLGSLGQVLVAVPARLHGGVGDQCKNRLRAGPDLPADTHDPGCLVLA